MRHVPDLSVDRGGASAQVRLYGETGSLRFFLNAISRVATGSYDEFSTFNENKLKNTILTK